MTEISSKQQSYVIAKIIAMVFILFFLFIIAMTIAAFYDPAEYIFGQLFTPIAIFFACLAFLFYFWAFCGKLSFRNLWHYWKRVLCGLLIMSGIVAVITYNLVLSIPPVFEDNLSYEQISQYNTGFPSKGKNFSYSRGTRGTFYCDFFIDEQGFRDWIASQDRWEYCRPLQEDDWVNIRPRHAFDPNATSDDTDEPTPPTDGFYAGFGEGNGARAVFDRSTNHVYYWTFY